MSKAITGNDTQEPCEKIWLFPVLFCGEFFDSYRIPKTKPGSDREKDYMALERNSK